MVDLFTGLRGNAKTIILRFSRDKIHVSYSTIYSGGTPLKPQLTTATVIEKMRSDMRDL